MEIAADASQQLLEFLQQAVDVADEDVFKLPGPLALTDFFGLSEISGFDPLKYESWEPQPSPDIDPTMSMFEVLSQGDVLLCHPYDSFDPVIDFVRQAARDPDVLTIKQTLYRVGPDSPVVAALM